MSGTGTQTAGEPVTEALIVAHGQPSAPDAPEAALAALAERVSACLPAWRIRSATFATPGRLEDEAARLADKAVVYPFFMARGWFVNRVLPDRLGGREVTIADPLGLDPDLPGLAADILRDAALRTPAPVLVAAHGSGKGRAAADAAYGFARRLAALLPDTPITTGFVEQSPTIADAARAAGPGALCLPFLAFPGGHYQTDIPDALDQAQFDGRVLPVLGMDPRVPGLIAAALARAANTGVRDA